MNSTSKILFLDLDGTLLNDKKEITPGNMEAIHEALQARHKVVISSGRATGSVEAMAQRMSLTSKGCYAITFNGACIYDLHQKKLLYHHTMPKATLRRVMNMAYEEGIHAHTYTANCVLSERETEALRFYSSTTKLGYRLVPDVCAALPGDPEKVITICLDDREKLCRFQEKLAAWKEGNVDSFFSSPHFLEVVPHGVCKGDAIKRLCTLLSIPMENTVSAGDAQNDISMLETTHISVVMKNAEPSMYPYGNYITKNDNNHDGIAEVIHQFILKNGESTL